MGIILVDRAGRASLQLFSTGLDTAGKHCSGVRVHSEWRFDALRSLSWCDELTKYQLLFFPTLLFFVIFFAF
jgi:hypothetical protein